MLMGKCLVPFIQQRCCDHFIGPIKNPARQPKSWGYRSEFLVHPYLKDLPTILFVLLSDRWMLTESFQQREDAWDGFSYKKYRNSLSVVSEWWHSGPTVLTGRLLIWSGAENCTYAFSLLLTALPRLQTPPCTLTCETVGWNAECVIPIAKKKCHAVTNKLHQEWRHPSGPLLSYASPIPSRWWRC